MKSLYQFGELEIHKDYLLANKSRLYFREPLKMDHRVIALLDISYNPIGLGNSLVIHAEYGVTLAVQTTRQLINEIHNWNGVGFTVARVVASLFSIKHLPAALGYVSYMPMTGGSRKSVYWIAAHHIESYSQEDGYAHFTTVQGHRIRLSFPRGNLKKRIHDVCMMSEFMVNVARRFMAVGLIDVNPLGNVGILREFEDCNCLLHRTIVRKIIQVEPIYNQIINYLLNHIGIEEPEAASLITFYSQNLNRLKRNY